MFEEAWRQGGRGGERELVSKLVSWCFEPSQPQIILSGLSERKKEEDNEEEKEEEEVKEPAKCVCVGGGGGGERRIKIRRKRQNSWLWVKHAKLYSGPFQV